MNQNEADKLFERVLNAIQVENKKQTETIQENLKAEINSIKIDINKLKTTVDGNVSKVETLENRTTNIQEELLEHKRKIRRNNVVIFGLKPVGDDIVNFTLNKLNNLLDTNLVRNDINNIRPIGKLESAPVIIEFISLLTKIEVLKRCKNLKGTSVAITDDLSKEDIIIRKKLVKFRKSFIERNEKAVIRGNHLLVYGQLYTLRELEDEFEVEEHTSVDEESDTQEQVEIQNQATTTSEKKTDSIKDDRNNVFNVAVKNTKRGPITRKQAKKIHTSPGSSKKKQSVIKLGLRLKINSFIISIHLSSSLL